MRYLSATSRVTLGLVCLTVSVLLLASTFGILPDRHQAVVEGRAKLCETMAINCSLLASQDERQMMQASLKGFALRNPEVLSAAVRVSNGSLIATVGDHSAHWDIAASQGNTNQQMCVPILASNRQWGQIEVCFDNDRPPGVLGWLQRPMIRLIAFIVGVSYLLYFFYLNKMLAHLDPSQVIPGRVRTTLDTLAEGLLIIDQNERIVLANRTFAQTVGCPARELIGRRASGLPWGDGETRLSADSFPWVRAIRQNMPQIGEMLVIKDGASQTRYFKVNASPILGPDGKARGAFNSFADVTVIEQNRAEMVEMLRSLSQSRDEIRRQNKELEWLATQDPLTGCLNRRSFFEKFEMYWKSAQRYQRPLSCVLLDIDHFKSINDRYGHGVGDLVLQKVAAALKSSVRDDDLIGRYGGEEFCILLPNIDLDEAARAAQRYRRKIAALNITNISVTASFGVSSLSLGASGPQKLLDEADKSLYVAKRSGRNQVARWDALRQTIEADPSNVERTTADDEASRIRPDDVICRWETSAQHDEDFDVAIPFHAVTALTSALAYRDESTAEHSRRVADLCVATAMDLMSVTDAYVLEVAALLHDIGKIGVPDSILLKPGPLTPDEWKIMGIHDRIGVEIVNSTFASDRLLEIIENHHAYFAGRGRDPNLPTGKDIPLGARILMIADAYDAMVSNRVYREGLTQEAAFAELRRCAGTQFDPDLVERFIEVVQARDENRQTSISGVSKQTALRIGEQIERLAYALDNEDLPGLAALAGRLNATAAKHGVTEIADVAAQLQAAACETDLAETMRLTNDLLDLCRSTQKVYLDCIEPEEQAEQVGAW